MLALSFRYRTKHRYNDYPRYCVIDAQRQGDVFLTHARTDSRPLHARVFFSSARGRLIGKRRRVRAEDVELYLLGFMNHRWNTLRIPYIVTTKCRRSVRGVSRTPWPTATFPLFSLRHSSAFSSLHCFAFEPEWLMYLRQNNDSIPLRLLRIHVNMCWPYSNSEVPKLCIHVLLKCNVYFKKCSKHFIFLPLPLLCLGFARIVLWSIAFRLDLTIYIWSTTSFAHSWNSTKRTREAQSDGVVLGSNFQSRPT